MYRLVLTELAHDDLESIVSYIAVQLVNPLAATMFLDEVEKRYKEVANHPNDHHSLLLRHLMMLFQ